MSLFYFCTRLLGFLIASAPQHAADNRRGTKAWINQPCPVPSTQTDSALGPTIVDVLTRPDEQSDGGGSLKTASVGIPTSKHAQFQSMMSKYWDQLRLGTGGGALLE